MWKKNVYILWLERELPEIWSSDVTWVTVGWDWRLQLWKWVKSDGELARPLKPAPHLWLEASYWHTTAKCPAELWSSCIVGNEGAMFWQGERKCGIAKMTCLTSFELSIMSLTPIISGSVPVSLFCLSATKWPLFFAVTAVFSLWIYYLPFY